MQNAKRNATNIPLRLRINIHTLQQHFNSLKNENLYN